MPNIENFVIYSHWQFDVIRHLFTLTIAVFAAGLVYFLTTSNQVAPRYRLSSSISAVVMTSAVLEIFQLYLTWRTGFEYRIGPEAAEAAGATLGAAGTSESMGATFGAWVPVEGFIFSNGYRYANWSIDVPMLLTQILVVLGIRGGDFWRTWWKFVVGGLGMVWTGYIGQFYEPAVAGLAPDVAAWPFWFWFAVSTAFYLYLMYLVWATFRRPVGPMSDRASYALKLAFWILVGSWVLYPIAYLVPAFWVDGTAIVVRQGLFTVADITSKLVFGVVLGRAARLRSAYEDHEMALATQADASPNRVPPTAARRNERV